MLARRPSLATTWAGMSRHQITVSVPAIRRPRAGRRAVTRGAVAAASAAIGVPSSPRPVSRRSKVRPRRSAAARARAVRSGIVGLGEVDEPPVVAEVDRQQLGVSVEAEADDDQRVEVAGEEVGQEEGRRVVVGEPGEGLAAGVELVAVGAGEPLDALGARGPDRAGHRSRSRRRRRRSCRTCRGPRGSCAGRPPGSARAGCGAWPAGRSPRRDSKPGRLVSSTSSRASAPQPMTRTLRPRRVVPEGRAHAGRLRRRWHGACR